MIQSNRPIKRVPTMHGYRETEGMVQQHVVLITVDRGTPNYDAQIAYANRRADMYRDEGMTPHFMTRTQWEAFIETLREKMDHA